jgi:phenylpyruvate tautomerase PptA (4-oxalocrotonate tautomerase family)
MVEVLGVPERDRFQIIQEHQPGRLRFDPSYLEIARDERFVLVRVALARGRTTGAKRAFYRRLSELLAERASIPPEDLAVVLIENEREDWSFGRGQANYLELPPAAWR